MGISPETLATLDLTTPGSDGPLVETEGYHESPAVITVEDPDTVEVSITIKE